MTEELKSLNCGEGFIPTCHITRQKYCSNECRHRYNNAKRYYKGEVNSCPECGDVVEQRERGAGRWRRFCSDRCRIKYDQRKIKERQMAKGRPKQICPNCGKEFQPEWGSGIARKYCSRFCYLLAMDQSHVEGRYEWCGETFTDTSGQGQRYCSRWCAVSGRFSQQGARRGRRRLSADRPEEWKEQLVQEVRASRSRKRGKRMWLVCGTTSMYTGLDGLMVIVRYHLKLDPCDGSVYVFRDGTGSMLKYIE